MLRVITCTMLRKDPGWASGSIACSLYYKKMNMQSNLKPSQDLCVAWCRLLHAAFHMPAQQERRSPQVVSAPRCNSGSVLSRHHKADPLTRRSISPTAAAARGRRTAQPSWEHSQGQRATALPGFLAVDSGGTIRFMHVQVRLCRLVGTGLMTYIQRLSLHINNRQLMCVGAMHEMHEVQELCRLEEEMTMQPGDVYHFSVFTYVGMEMIAPWEGHEIGRR